MMTMMMTMMMAMMTTMTRKWFLEKQMSRETFGDCKWGEDR